MVVAAYQQETRVGEKAGLLVIEDDPAVRSLLQQVFESGYSLCFVESGAKAIETLRQETIDLVLLDVTSPQMNGFEALQAIRAVPCTLPVILIAALEDSSSAVQGLQLGANDYVTKPLDVDVVRTRVGTQIALKHAEDARKQTLTQLKFTQEMQESFTRIVSHDLKGPLTNIRMAQFMLRDILRDNDEASGILDNMDVTLNGMIEMIRVFLDAMDSHQLAPTLETLEAHDLIVEIVEQYRLAADRKRIEFEIHDSQREVIADQRLLRQILSNLISNAVKFSLPGTQTSIWTEACGERVRICVADGGPGIPLEDRAKLFSMFGKASTRPTGDETSTGLGLWIVKELTQLQHGSVGIDQPAAGGSLFWIELPAAKPEA